MRLVIKKIEYTEVLKFLVIRVIYTYLAVTVLSKLWYSGSDGYMISYNVIKDVVSFMLLALETVFFHLIRFSGEFKKAVANFIFLLYFIPLNASTALNDMPYTYLISTSVYALLFILALGLVSKGDNKKECSFSKNIPGIYRRPRVMNALLFVCIFFILYKFSYNGFTMNLSLQTDSIYSNRAAYSEYVTGIAGSFLAYAITFISGIVSFAAPVYLYFSLEGKKIAGVIVAIGTILAEFSLSSGKGVLFFAAIVLFVFFLEKRKDNDIVKTFNSVFLGLMIFCFFETRITENCIFYTYLVRRTMYAPAWLNALYYHFFAINNKIHWSQNVFMLQKILPHVYDVSPMELISINYFKGLMPSPNTGMFAEVFMHWGYLGVIIYSPIYYFLFNFASRVYKEYGRGVAVVIGFDVALKMSNIPVTRTDFVLSFVLFTLILCLYTRYKKKKIF